MPDIRHKFKKSEIMQSEVDRQVEEIIDLLKKKKQTYAVNKFVLSQAMEELTETIV